MVKESRRVKKIKRMLRKACLPRWLHRFGPKKYEFWQHILALLIKQECKLSYRRVCVLLQELGFEVPSYSALCKSLKRIPLAIWQALLAVTASIPRIVALDGTGMSRSLPSPYYCRRIDKPYPVEVPLKLSIAVDTKTKKILALRLRAKRAHDIKDAVYLLKKIPKPIKVVGDSAYDAEWLYEKLWMKGIQPVVKIRRNAKWGFYRHKVKKHFKQRTYNRRSMVESVFHSTKTKFGPNLKSLRIKAQRAEMYCRAIAHNTIRALIRHFQHSHNE